MSKVNPLAGLIGYGDSDEDSDEEQPKKAVMCVPPPNTTAMPPQNISAIPPQAPAASGPGIASVPPGIHPAPVPYCPWSACYDEGTGFTYYWNQQTNVVTWEAPPEYLLAVKIAQQHMSRSGSAEVSAEEWQLYQQALAEKQNAQNRAKNAVKPATSAKNDSFMTAKDKNIKAVKRRRNTDEEQVKIELITSYSNSDSESNDEESPVKPATLKPQIKPKVPPKKPKKATIEYGPALPPNVEYTVPIGPEMPPELISETPKSPVNKLENHVAEQEMKNSPKVNDEDQDDDVLLKKLKDKAKLLEKLGGEIPSELQKIIEDETKSRTASPRNLEESSRDSKVDTNIDDLLDEIEKKELPKVKKSKKDIFSNPSSQNNSQRNSPKSTNGDCTPPLEENMKPLFPSSKNIEESALFPSAVNIKEENPTKDEEKEVKPDPVVAKKTGNMYLMDANEPIENTNRKKLRISNSVLPERKKTEPVPAPEYTTKYSQHIEGFSSDRTGLGFTKEEESESAPKNTISYGNGLLFTKGEVLNEDKKDEALDDLTDLVEAKLKYLNSLQVSTISPVQEMLIQMQTLAGAFRSGALWAWYWRRWARAAAAELQRHEAAAAPRGWLCVFQRSEGRYKYRRECDGFEQWEYPALANTDMEICTTPPHPGPAALEEAAPPPPPPAATPPLPAAAPPTPPPPVWDDPPPPGTDDPPPPPPPPTMLPEPSKRQEKKQEIGDELLSFYSDIAELEKSAPPPPAPAPLPPPPPPARAPAPPLPPDDDRDKSREVKKKKSKVKISASIGMKHKTVSSLVAKWQQVAEEINSD